jgi:hypothetical protein
MAPLQAWPVRPGLFYGLPQTGCNIPFNFSEIHKIIAQIL